MKKKRLINKKNRSQYVLIKKENVMKMRYVFLRMIVLVSIMIFCGSIPSYAEEVRGVTKDTIRIAIITDMSGPAVPDYGPYREGVVNYLKYTNEQGGINGRKIKMFIEDDRYSIPIAIAAFKKVLYRDGVLAIMGLGTPTIIPLYDKIEKEKIPTFGFSVAESMVIPLKRYVFTHTASYEEGLRVLVDYIVKDLKAKDPKIAYLAPDLVWGKQGLDVVKERTKLHGTKLVDSQILGLSPLDATSEVLSLKRKEINYVIVHNTAGATAALMRDGKKLGLNAIFLGSHPACSDITVELAKVAAKNFYGVHSFNPWYSGAPGASKMTEVFSKYNPGKTIPSIYYVQGWVSAMVFAEGLKRAGKDLNNESFVGGIESIKGLSTGDLSENMSYGQEKHRGANSVKIFKADVEKGRLTASTGWIKPAE